MLEILNQNTFYFYPQRGDNRHCISVMLWIELDRPCVEKSKTTSTDNLLLLCCFRLPIRKWEASTMSNYSRVIHHATSILCSNKGSLALQQLHRKVFQRVEITEDDFWYIVKKCSRFVVVRNRERTDEWGTDCVIVAKTSLRLCKNYTKQDCRDCQDLHLCKYFVYGNCRFGKGR